LIALFVHSSFSIKFLSSFLFSSCKNFTLHTGKLEVTNTFNDSTKDSTYISLQNGKQVSSKYKTIVKELIENIDETVTEEDRRAFGENIRKKPRIRQDTIKLLESLEKKYKNPEHSLSNHEKTLTQMYALDPIKDAPYARDVIDAMLMRARGYGIE